MIARRIELVRVGSDPVGQVIATITHIAPELGDMLHRPEIRPYATHRHETTLDVWAFDGDIARAVYAGAQYVGTLRALHEGVVLHEEDAPGQVVLETLTPVHMRAGRDAGASNSANRRHALFADPVRIVEDVQLKWTALGHQMEMPNARRIGGETRQFALEVYAAGRHRWVGWQGELLLDLRPLSPRDRRSVWLLLRFAELRGVGAKTTYGMGRVRVTPR